MAGVSAPPLVSLKKILVATDFSPCSHNALLCAAALARQANGTVYLAHVLPVVPLSPVPMDAGPVFSAPVTNDPNFRMQQFASTPEMAGIASETLLGQGDLWLALQDMIDEHDIDLVVVGTHGREGLKKLVLGSVAEEVFRRAGCPVMTVGPHVERECFEGRLRRVLFATDFLPSSLHALAHAVSLAQLHQASLTVVHAIPCAVPCDENTGAIAAAGEAIADARSQAKDLLPEGVQADVVVEIGVPDQVIVEVARRQQASMIVLGLHPQASEFMAEHFPWTTAHHVVCNAQCPVMTVR